MEPNLLEAVNSSGLNNADWLIIAFIIVLTTISLFRGFVKEAMSLIRLAAAVVIGYMFASDVSELFKDSIKNPEYAYALAFFALFIMVMIIGAILASLAKGLIRMAGLGPIDRLLGAVFGCAKGCTIVVFLVTLVNLTPLKTQSLWLESRLVPGFVELALWSQQRLSVENVL